ncbi:MAG: RNA polymerase factor sigma-54 [Phocaeicola sp.]
MVQGSRQIQSQAQQQVQTLSPQQILVVKLLELPTLELEERVSAELLDNPALEEGKEDIDSSEEENIEEEREDKNDTVTEYGDVDFSLGDYRTADDIPDYKLQENNRSREGTMEEIPFSDNISFYELLREQLAMQELEEEEEKEIAEYLIGSLDDDGLLRKELDPILDELAIYQGIYTTAEKLNNILKVIQEFDPAGIGARSLQECLLIQINRKPYSPLRELQKNIIEKCCDDFTRKNKERIKQKLDISEEQYQEAIGELTKLNPRPGSSLGETLGRGAQQITPDFIIESFENGEISIQLNNRNVPELRLSREFTQLLEEHTYNKKNQSKESKEALLFLKQKVDAAQGFINAVKQRQQTLLTTMQAIVDIQRPFFEEGDESLLKPMILKDVAERTALDISTISRVSNSKYAQTNYGIYALKYFFSDGYTTENGEELSVREIRRILKECVEEEDREKPYTDDDLAELLKEKGYPIARRTVAKYRQQLHIPVARLRR